MVASKNLKFQLLGSCEHPLRLRNRYTDELVTVPCGKCKACILNKASKYSLLCSLEEISNRFSYMITLTYSNRHIPKMLPIKVTSDRITKVRPFKVRFHRKIDGWTEYVNTDTTVTVTDTSKPIYDFIGVTRRSELYHQVIVSKCFSPEYIKEITDKCELDGCLSYLDYRDLQLFLKRFRKNVSKISNDTVRFYAVGEYGPSTFRAHWHIIPYFNDPVIAENIQQIVRKSWRYGRVDCSASRGSASSYVSGYVNSLACTPDLLASKLIRPRCCHSFHLGFSFFQKDIEKIYEKGLAFFDETDYVIGGKSVHIKPPLRFRSYLYPRCIGYSLSSKSCLYEKYRFLYTLKRLFPEVSCIDYLDLISGFLLGVYEVPPGVCSSLYPFLSQSIPDFERSQIDEKYCRSVVYNLIACSRHFINFCCNGDMSLFDLRFEQLYKFYKDLDYSRLTDWYKAIEEYQELYPGHSLYLFYECPTMAYGEEEYNRSTLEFHRQCNLNPVYQESLYDLYIKYDKSIKHKEQNDKNRIFMIDD